LSFRFQVVQAHYAVADDSLDQINIIAEIAANCSKWRCKAFAGK